MKTWTIGKIIALSLTGVVVAGVITAAVVFWNPLITLLGGNGNAFFKPPETAYSNIQKNPDLYEIEVNDGNEKLVYSLKNGLGSLSVAAKDGEVFEVIIIVDTTKIKADTATGVINEVTELLEPDVGFVDRLTLAAHGSKEIANIPAELTTDTEFKIERTIGDYTAVVTKDKGSDLVKAVFTR